MSRGDLLYVKQMDITSKPYSNSDTEDNDDEGMWDDRTLNSAYERAMALERAKVDTAKRIAQATNTLLYDEPFKSEESNNKKTKSGSTRNPKKSNKLWSAGMYCRAVYKEDGREYEAIITRLLNDKECLITFLGYENTDIVALKCLKPSQGKRKRISQIHQAMADNLGEGFADNNDVYNYDSSNTATDRSSSVNNKPKNKKGHRFPGVQLPNLPYPLPQMPDIKSPRNLTCPIDVMDVPIAPPLPFLQDDVEEQALSSMLISWYMSGYYAGLYQGLKRARKGERHN